MTETPCTITSPRDLANALGRKRMADALDVGLTAIGNACDRGKFPADWILIVQSLCEADNLPCPDNFFNVRLPKYPHDVDECQAKPPKQPVSLP